LTILVAYATIVRMVTKRGKAADYTLKNSFGYSINRVTNAIRNQFNKCLKPFGITGEQFAIMKVTNDHSGSIQTQIAKIISKDKTTITRAINSLEKKGLILKKRDKRDKRAYSIEITEKSKEILSKTIPITEKYDELVKSKLISKEVETFFKILDIMLETCKEWP